jgi:peptidoglycan-associated lipoprotein
MDEEKTMRNRTGTSVLVFLLAAALLGAASCKKKPPQTTAEAKPAETGAPPPATNVPPPSTAPSEVESSGLPGTVAAINTGGYLKDAFFDYDKADLRDDARAALSTDADWLKKYRSVQFLIEGHCDERGTEEYNLALGDRRSNAAKEYLISLGVDASRIKTVSYGKERPFCNESSEDCWQKNRRAHFLATAR